MKSIKNIYYYSIFCCHSFR